MNTTPARARALLGVLDIAKRLRCSTRYVWQLRQAGALPDPIDIGGLLRWRPEDVDRWIQACPQLVPQRKPKAATTKARKPSGRARTRAGPPDPGSQTRPRGTSAKMCPRSPGPRRRGETDRRADARKRRLPGLQALTSCARNTPGR